MSYVVISKHVIISLRYHGVNKHNKHISENDLYNNRTFSVAFPHLTWFLSPLGLASLGLLCPDENVAVPARQISDPRDLKVVTVVAEAPCYGHSFNTV